MGALESIKAALGLGTDDEEPTGPTFEERQVSPLGEADFGFRGEYRYPTDGGETVIERRFDVVLDDDGAAPPRVEIVERRRVDGERVGEEETTELEADVDPELGEFRLKDAVGQVLERWHREHDPRPASVREASADETNGE